MRSARRTFRCSQKRLYDFCRDFENFRDLIEEERGVELLSWEPDAVDGPTARFAASGKRDTLVVSMRMVDEKPHEWQLYVLTGEESRRDGEPAELPSIPPLQCRYEFEDRGRETRFSMDLTLDGPWWWRVGVAFVGVFARKKMRRTLDYIGERVEG